MQRDISFTKFIVIAVAACTVFFLILRATGCAPTGNSSLSQEDFYRPNGRR